MTRLVVFLAACVTVAVVAPGSPSAMRLNQAVHGPKVAGSARASVGGRQTAGETSYEKARRIINAVFPDATQAAALRVVGCETGGTYDEWASNIEGASGWFQVLQGNAGRVLYYRGRTLVIPSGARLFLPWTNTRVALFLSHGGTDWREWQCKP